MNDAKRTYHRLKLRARRRVRRQKRQVEDITVLADNSLDKHFFRRLGRLYQVRRFVLSWTLLMMFIGFGAIWQVRGLDRFYMKLAPASGGIYREGLLGAFTTSNPLFAVSPADVSVSRLVFSGLFRLSPEGKIESELANTYEMDETELIYTVHLRDNVTWHDGSQFTARDVEFTYNTIKNPATKSPLFSGWSSIDVKATDEYTVVFTLPNSLSSFPYSLTNGIVPRHILSAYEPADLRSSLFNTVTPIGTGPFIFKQVEVLGSDIDDRQEKVTLDSNEAYFKAVPLINGVVLRTYRNEDEMVKAFERQEITSMVGLATVSDRLLEQQTVQTFSTPLTSQVMIFLNNSSEALKDKNVRKALLRATDTTALRQSIGYELVEADSPFLKSHFAYDKQKVQLKPDIAEANKLLDEAGWLRTEDGSRQKDGVQFKLRLISQSLTEYATVVQGIQKQWGELGVQVEAFLQPEEDVQSGAVVRHDYDVLLYGISLGLDPDVYAYWHSSQADPRLKTRLNLSEYSNQAADKALEAGRTRLNEELRTVKYRPFLDAWLDEVPAIALYQPRFLFVARGTLEGYKTGQFNGPADRFYSISDWQVRREKAIQ